MLKALQLSRTEGVGPITYKRLLERFGTPEKALQALPEMARRGGRKENFVVYAEALAAKEIDHVHKIGAELLALGHPLYPKQLAALEDAPPVLTIRGNTALLQEHTIGIVGARNASLSGQQMAKALASGLGQAGLKVSSGLARGIDTAAHQASLTTGTIAVVAGGINVVYPNENAKLYEAICAQGVVVAESPFGTEPLAQHFPKRNRIISGLSLGVVVVEATLKSGSLITARMAGEQGRDVFAVPGNPMDPRAAGPNALLKDGACLVRNAQDILEAVASSRPKWQAEEPAATFTGQPPVAVAEGEVEKARAEIIACLSFDPVPTHLLQQELAIPPSVFQAALLELELAGRVQHYAGGRLALLPQDH